LLPLKIFALSDFVGVPAPTIKFGEFQLRDITRQKNEHCMLFVGLMDRIEDWDQQIQCKMTGKCPIAKVLLNGMERPPLFRGAIKQKEYFVSEFWGANAGLYEDSNKAEIVLDPVAVKEMHGQIILIQPWIASLSDAGLQEFLPPRRI